jgi:myo-inositol-1(or 4)-monophosphatase
VQTSYSPEQVAGLRDFAIDLAESAGALIRRLQPTKRVVSVTKSSPVDPVTEMDQKVERYLVERIMAIRPGDGILGEEGNSIPSTSGLTWVLDPIDGTVNYIYGIASFAVSVAVVAGDPRPEVWDPLAGAVHAVVWEKTWAAGRGLGATAGGKSIEPVTPPPLDRSMLATGFGYEKNRRIEQIELLRSIIGEVRDIRRLGSASIDLCLQAEGIVDLYYEIGLQPWDFAAGALIAQEAGSTVTDLAGGPPSNAMTIAGRGEAVDQLKSLLRTAFNVRQN